MYRTEEGLKLCKETIIHRAFDLFCQKGIDKVSMEEIAKSAGVGVASVYRYFKTKAELALNTQQILWDNIQREITAEISDGYYTGKSGCEQLSFLLHSFEQLYKEHSNYLLFAADYKMYLIRKNMFIEGSDYNQMLEPVKRLFCQALQNGMEDGSLKIKGNSEDVFYVIWGILRGFIDEMVLYDYSTTGENPWFARFHFLCNLILKQLQPNADYATVK